MRVSLDPDQAEFVKQVAGVRRFLRTAEARGGQAAVSARLMSGAYIEFVNSVRAELKSGEVNPPGLLTATGDLLGNMAITMVQSMYDAPAEAQEEAIDRILGAAKATAMRTIENDARMARDAEHKADKPNLTVVDGGKADA